MLPHDLRDTIVACYSSDILLKQVSMKYNLPSRKSREALDDLNVINELRKCSGGKFLIKNAKRKQVTR